LTVGGAFHSLRSIRLERVLKTRPWNPFMNAKLLFKTIFLIAVLLLLVLMGMDNRSAINFTLPPLLNKIITQPAAIMYFGFFAVGVLTGTVLTAGGKRGGGGGKSKGN
jgi:uncharacterized integral membrane protein